VKRFLPIVLLWTLPPAPCAPAALEVWDAYITGPGTNNYSAGVRALPPSQTSLDLAPYKPHLGCAIGWEFPVAVGSDAQPLPPECQPSNFSTSEGTWEGM
jgi:hypothetical protein